VNILVTGASGFVGRHLVGRMLAARPWDTISVLLLPDETLPEPFVGKVEILRGDVRDAESVRNAVRGKNIVFHMAGFISYWVLDAGMMEAVNVGGVRAIVAACVEFKVKRLVHVSSVGAVGFNLDGKPADEETPFNWPESFGYMTTKRDGQKVVKDAVRDRGLDAVIVNPASVMGPGDPSAKSEHNRLYASMYKGDTFFGTLGGGLAVVDVRDLAETILVAADKGRAGEVYLCVGANATYTQVLELMAMSAGKRLVPFAVPSLALTAVGWSAELFSRLTRKRPFITAAYGRLSGWTAYYSGEKSRRELGVTYRPLEETIADGCEYFERVYLKN
jgi:dihydroflavonol-4-reductase